MKANRAETTGGIIRELITMRCGKSERAQVQGEALREKVRNFDVFGFSGWTLCRLSH